MSHLRCSIWFHGETSSAVVGNREPRRSCLMRDEATLCVQEDKRLLVTAFLSLPLPRKRTVVLDQDMATQRSERLLSASKPIQSWFALQAGSLRRTPMCRRS